MAVTIIGGQMLCLLLTLLISPGRLFVLRRSARVGAEALLAWLRRAGKPGEAPPEPEIPG